MTQTTGRDRSERRREGLLHPPHSSHPYRFDRRTEREAQAAHDDAKPGRGMNNWQLKSCRWRLMTNGTAVLR